MNNFNIHNEVTQTINSLDNWQKIEPDMFFASRVLNKLNQSQSKIFHLNPIMKAAIIAGVLLINSISITYYILPEKNFETSDNNITTMIYEEYNINGYLADNDLIFE